MNRYIFYIGILVVAALGSCSRIDDAAPTEEIMLSAAVTDVEVGTKAQAYEGTTPSGDNPLSVELWFSNNEDDYSANTPSEDTRTYIPCHTYITFNSENITPIMYNRSSTSTGNNALTYPTSGASVYCVGLYPQNVWAYNNGKFEATINGEDDLMFSTQISGKWNEQFGTNNNSLQFRHMLTWLRVTLCATSYDAVDAWGEITSVTFSTPDKISVGDADATLVEYSGNTVIELLEEPKTLSILKTDVASIFCAPRDRGILITVKTKDGRTARTTISSQDGFNAGNQYVVVLYFDSLSIIDSVCTLESWENQNDNLYLEP